VRQLMTLSVRLDSSSWNRAAPVQLPPVTTIGATIFPDTMPRVAQVGPEAYSSFDAYGLPGGPSLFGNTLNMNVTAGRFVLRVGQAQVSVVLAPPELREQDNFYSILAANSSYLITIKGYRRQDLIGPLRGNKVDYVDHFSTGTWTKTVTEGTYSRLRIHGNWLTVIVQYWHPDNKTNPGRELERMGDRLTPDLPDVQGRYAGDQGGHSEIPGKLQLINLADGRRFQIDTGMEDSEILAVTEDRVLYRINDSIYECPMQTKGLGKPALLIQDNEAVPEIHWAFLADASALPAQKQ